jgi:hypothetical protein
LLCKKPSDFFARNNLTMKEYKKSQLGYSVVEHYPDNHVYSIKQSGEDEITYLIPCVIWDALSHSRARAEQYRKSRDYFEEARNTEKQRGIEVCERLVVNHNRLVQDLHNEITYLQNELEEVGREHRTFKAVNLLLTVVIIVMGFYIFI